MNGGYLEYECFNHDNYSNYIKFRADDDDSGKENIKISCRSCRSCSKIKNKNTKF